MKKVLTSTDGTYVLDYQLRFFLNDEAGIRAFERKSEDFMLFIDQCRAYNHVSDLMDNNTGCASLVWDGEDELPTFLFPDNGIVETELVQLGFELLMIDDEDDE